MKKILITTFSLLLTLSAFAQKGSNQFALFGGYESFPELWEGKGYNIGIEYKHYVLNRIYVAANFHAGVNDGDKFAKYENFGIFYEFNLLNSVRDYMIGFGLGGDLLQKGRHKIYIQGTAGLGTSEQKRDGIVGSPSGTYDRIKTFEENSTRFAISVSAGYDFRITDWLAVGVNYTGWQIGYEYKNSCNAKISLIF